MFRESDKNPQFDVFSSPATLLQGYSLNYYLKKDSRHNVFRERVAMRVNENIFKCLYCSANGSPNASLRVPVGMMILKEGRGRSDEQLFEQCRYNLLVRSGLGVMNLTETCHSAESKDNFSKEENDANETEIVLDTLTRQFLTGYLIATRKTNSATENQEKKWRIVTDEGKYRYFTLENVRTSLLRQELRDVPIEERRKRNNVEASIFQLGLHCTGGKTRYRGHAANRLWAYSRAMWINFGRIQKYVMQTGERSLLSEKGLNFSHF